MSETKDVNLKEVIYNKLKIITEILLTTHFYQDSVFMSCAIVKDLFIEISYNKLITFYVDIDGNILNSLDNTLVYNGNYNVLYFNYTSDFYKTGLILNALIAKKFKDTEVTQNHINKCRDQLKTLEDSIAHYKISYNRDKDVVCTRILNHNDCFVTKTVPQGHFNCNALQLKINDEVWIPEIYQYVKIVDIVAVKKI